MSAIIAWFRSLDGFTGPLLIMGVIIFFFLLVTFLPFRRTIFKIAIWVTFAAAIGGTYWALNNFLFSVSDKILSPILPNKYALFYASCISIVLISTVFLFICSRIRASEFYHEDKLRTTEHSRAGVRYTTTYDSFGNPAGAKPYYDDGERYDDTENFGVKARFAKLFGFWLMLFFYFLEIATPFFFVKSMPSTVDELAYFHTTRQGISLVIGATVALIVIVVIQIISYRRLIKVFAKRMDKKYNKWADRYHPNRHNYD